MPILAPPDSHYVAAALGWIELGNAAEALAELDRLASVWQQHPAVLETRWLAFADLKQWPSARLVAEELVRVQPENVSGWLHRAYALRRVVDGGLQPAWEVLRPAAEQFPKEAIVAYNLACYACQLGNLEEARRWLERAKTVGDATEILRLALADTDLEPLWPELRST